MKPVAIHISTFAAIAALIGPATTVVGAPLPTCASGPRGYPSFCDIPPKPTGTPSAAEFKSLVVDTRQAGRRVVEASAAVSGPTDTRAFADRARADVSPPAALTTPAFPQGADAFARSAKARATPPEKPR